MNHLSLALDSESVALLQDAIAGSQSVALFDQNLSVEVRERLERAVDEYVARVSRTGMGVADVAVVLFTSGSTGTPKGVVYDRELVQWLLEDSRYQLARNDVNAKTVLFANPAYNAGFLRSLLPLVGPSITIIDPAVTPASEILQTIQSEGIEQVSFVPSLIDSLYGASVAEDLRLDRVHTAYIFGEKVSWDRIRQARRIVAKDAHLVVRYATTEAPGGILNYEIPSTMPLGSGLVPLGVPVSPGRVALVPVDGDPAVAQIAVREPIAVGYLDEAMTRQRFVTDEAGVRWWLSGDLATKDAEGVYHFGGRSDDVIKINGRLVDPAHAERVILETPGVLAAVVLPDSRDLDRPRLVAHVVVEGTEVTPNGLFRGLFAALPHHQVPHILVKHDALPLTSRGKIDRQALKNGSFERWRSDERSVPSSNLSGMVLKILREVLDQPELNATEDTWGAGMDSLHALEFVTQLENLGYGQFPPTVVLERRSAQALTAYFQSSPKFVPQSQIVLNKQGSKPPIFCVPGAGATALAFRPFAQEVGPDQPVVVIEARARRIRGDVDNSVVGRARVAVEEIHRHPISRPVRIVGHCVGGAVALETALQLHRLKIPAEVVFFDSPSVLSQRVRTRLSWWWQDTTRKASLWLKGVALKVPRFSDSETGFSRDDYDSLRDQLEQASRAYRPGKATFPLLLLLSGDTQIRRLSKAHTQLTQIVLDAEHLELLKQPFVKDFARHTVAFFDRHQQTNQRASQ